MTSFHFLGDYDIQVGDFVTVSESCVRKHLKDLGGSTEDIEKWTKEEIVPRKVTKIYCMYYENGEWVSLYTTTTINWSDFEGKIIQKIIVYLDSKYLVTFTYRVTKVTDPNGKAKVNTPDRMYKFFNKHQLNGADIVIV